MFQNFKRDKKIVLRTKVVVGSAVELLLDSHRVNPMNTVVLVPAHSCLHFRLLCCNWGSFEDFIVKISLLISMCGAWVWCVGVVCWGVWV